MQNPVFLADRETQSRCGLKCDSGQRQWMVVQGGALMAAPPVTCYRNSPSSSTLPLLGKRSRLLHPSSGTDYKPGAFTVMNSAVRKTQKK
ncbi:hypothetical protein H920_08158 [Fukomys damarensis]|uniref:Uncharacterized protein n=1 Tax=Fukomys damarensis TaxID=885580 RepID=A0A091DH99_FUKDA|nr:hypothetical protein H920_08158 [Fukomys damarensis]